MRSFIAGFLNGKMMIWQVHAVKLIVLLHNMDFSFTEKVDL